MGPDRTCLKWKTSATPSRCMFLSKYRECWSIPNPIHTWLPYTSSLYRIQAIKYPITSAVLILQRSDAGFCFSLPRSRCYVLCKHSKHCDSSHVCVHAQALQRPARIYQGLELKVRRGCLDRNLAISAWLSGLPARTSSSVMILAGRRYGKQIHTV